MDLEFRLDDGFVDSFADRQPKWGPVGYVTYKRTYARDVDGLSERYRTLAERHGLVGVEEWWLTVTRVVEGTYRIQERHCRQNRLHWDADKAQRSANEMFGLIFNFKFLPPGRGLWMMGTDYVFEHGGAALNNPLHEDTRILTQEYGWTTLKKIEGQKVHVLTSSKLYGRDHTSSAACSKWVEASISIGEIQPCVEITFVDDFKQTRKIIASQNHRWFKRPNKKGSFWERVSSMDLCEGDLVPIVRPQLQTEPSRYAQQHGLFFGDGVRSNGHLPQFSDSVHLVEDLFDVRDVKHHDDSHISVSGCPLWWGSIPTVEQAKDRRYALGFLMGYFAADGCVTEENCAPSIASSRHDELQSVRNIFEDLGIRTTEITGGIRETNFGEGELYNFKINKHDLWPEFFLKRTHREKYERHMASITKQREKNRAMVKSVRPVGDHRVLCATVPHYEQFVTEGFILTSNCAFVTTANIDRDFAAPFCFLMDMSMLGVGVGGDVRGAGKVTIQDPTICGGTFAVEDSREGWVSMLARVLNAFVGKGTLPEKISYEKLRKKGEPIKGFGGKASGPDPLKECFEDVIQLLRSREGELITSADITDLFNLIGKCVVSGNVRRSAEIMFGAPDDETFLDLKNRDLHASECDHHRWMSNNSVIVDVGQDYTAIAARTAKNGEPGYMWLDNARQWGRMADEPDHRDHGAMGGNPCLEQTLWPFELCCLVETMPSLHESYAEFQRTLKFAYLYGKTVSLLPTHDQRTNAVLLKNRRIGTSMTGIVQAMRRHGTRNFFGWCNRGYKYVRRLDDIYSDWLAIPRSIKVTSVKPSGTVSLLPGVTPGVHFPHSEYYFRVIRFDTDSPMLKKLKLHGYPCFELDPKKEPNTVAVYFPVHEENFDRAKDDVSMMEQLEIAAQMQEYWADNQVSSTVTFKPEEAKDIARVLPYYEVRLKGISFLPLENHGYEHAPYQKISKEEYETAVEKITPVVSFNGSARNEVIDKFCDGESCAI